MVDIGVLLHAVAARSLREEAGWESDPPESSSDSPTLDSSQAKTKDSLYDHVL